MIPDMISETRAADEVEGMWREWVDDMLRECVERVCLAADDDHFVLPWVVEVTDVENVCVCRSLFDEDMNLTFDPTLATSRSAPLPSAVTLTDKRGRRLKAAMEAPAGTAIYEA